MLYVVKHIITPLVNLLFPPLCISCFKDYYAKGNSFCIHCLATLPFTDFHLDTDHELIQRFYGKIELNSALALFYFFEKSEVQEMLNKIKYRQRPDIAVRLGEIYGSILKNNNSLEHVDLIIPVPLHPKKLYSRGYNQSFHFAKGLSKKLNIPVDKGLIKRIKNTDTQTKKTLEERRDNIKDAFQLSQKSLNHINHIVIVDDVITTGTTIEACAELFINAGVKEISFCCIATPKFGL